MQYKKLGEVATYINGYAFKPDDRGEVGLPIIRIQDLTGNSYDLGFYNGEYPKKIEINDGDILISWSASLGVYVWNKGKALLNQHIFKVAFDKIEIDKKFFVYAVREKLEEMISKTHGATMKHIVKRDFENTLIPFPPINEQILIASKLEKLSRIIELRNKEIDNLDKLIKARFVELFGDPVSNSYGLPEATLPELGEFGRGVSKHRPRNDPKLLGGDYPLIQTGDVANAGLYITSYNSTYSELGLKQSKMWDKGTLCITIAANIAKTAILEFDACFPDSVVGFTANEKTSNIFIHCWFSFFQAILESQAPESAQKNINIKILSELKVIVPEKDKQDEFVDFINQVDKSKVAVQKSLVETQLLFDSLMQEYFG
ncbi:MAG: restriction endonuclease subunit S [Lachnospiraceae bacterium]|nr:restriction endonuclease subunit S [Lachnospiraceae bacterium]